VVDIFIVNVSIRRGGFLALANPPLQPLGYRVISFKKSFISKTDSQIAFFELFWALFAPPAESLLKYSKTISIRSITHSIQNIPRVLFTKKFVTILLPLFRQNAINCDKLR